MQNLWNLSLFFYHVTVEMEKNPATFLSLFTCNVLTFLITLYQPFSNLHWHFPYCNYLAVTQINIKIGYKKQKCDQKELYLIGKTHSSATCYSRNIWPLHCVKSVQIRSYFWSVFSCIRIE